MRVFAIMFAALGGLIVMFATWEGLRRRRRERTGQLVRAKVVEIIVERILNRGGSGDMHFPVFEFVAADGRSVRRQSSFGNGMPVHRVGDEIVVWYDPADPEQCDIVGEGRGFALVLELVAKLPRAGGRERAAPPSAEASPAIRAFRRAPGGAVCGQDPPAGNFATRS